MGFNNSVEEQNIPIVLSPTSPITPTSTHPVIGVPVVVPYVPRSTSSNKEFFSICLVLSFLIITTKHQLFYYRFLFCDGSIYFILLRTESPQGGRLGRFGMFWGLFRPFRICCAKYRGIFVYYVYFELNIRNFRHFLPPVRGL